MLCLYQSDMFFVLPQKVPIVTRDQAAEQLLMSGVSIGDNDCTNIFYNRFLNIIKSLSIKSLGYKYDIENISHDIIHSICKSSKMYDYKKSRLSTWVSIIAKRKLIDLHRRDKNKPSCYFYELDNLPGNGLDEFLKLQDTESSERFFSLIKKLSANQQDIFIQIYVRGMSIKSISRQSQITVRAVQSRHRRGLKCLKQNYII